MTGTNKQKAQKKKQTENPQTSDQKKTPHHNPNNLSFKGERWGNKPNPLYLKHVLFCFKGILQSKVVAAILLNYYRPGRNKY